MANFYTISKPLFKIVLLQWLRLLEIYDAVEVHPPPQSAVDQGKSLIIF
jgi:hypothetical protein